MRATVEWLVALDASTKAELSAASAWPFTVAAPAPSLAASTRTQTLMATVDAGSAEAAHALAPHSSACLLNFANGFHCGGGFDHARGTQEEDIFRKTSCFLSLWPRRRAGDEAGVLKRATWIGDYDGRSGEPFYPLSECGAIYSPNVVAVRNLQSDCALLGRVPSHGFALVTAAAQNVTREGPFREDLLREKIRTVLWLAATHGHDTLVLGAFGAGAFANPVDVVARVFNDLLVSEFQHRFRLVLFAVPKKFRRNFSAFAHRFPELPFGDVVASTFRRASS